MPKRVTHNWLDRVASGLVSGALALSLLATGGSSAAGSGVRPAFAEDMDCYNDKDLYNTAECAAQRELDRKTGNTPKDAKDAQGASTMPGASGAPPAPPSTASSDTPPEGEQGASQPPQQQAAQGGDEEEDAKPAPRAPVNDPHEVVFTLADAGKEATPYKDESGTDKFGKWALTRFERDRSNGASALGPNVMQSKVWVAKDVETAKGLFKEQAAVKGMPERTESAQGSIEKIKPTKYGEEFAFDSAYYQDKDDKVYQHYRFVIRVGNLVSVVYLFGREEFFQDQKDRTWTGQGDWFTGAIFHRM